MGDLNSLETVQVNVGAREEVLKCLKLMENEFREFRKAKC